MSVLIPLRQWRTADPAILIGRNIIRHDPNTCSNSMGEGIRTVIITESKP